MERLVRILKKEPRIHAFGRWLRRVIFHSKLIYFLSNTTRPLSDQYGFDRGIPIDRFFIEDFLKKNKLDIKGKCLEVLDNNYTTIYGEKRVTESDVLDINLENKKANIIDDLRNLQTISNDTYDTIILTQVLQFIDNVDSVISECYRILKPGGTILATLPSISRADCTSGVPGDFWRFTQASARYLFEKKFKPETIEVDFYGNVRSGIYFYAGLALSDTPRKVLLDKDDNFPTIITISAKK
jgi:SAM-dependent methyltransferase